MRKAFQIFKRDLRRLLKNPVAVIVTIGVAIIPSLYAWFNILANWDPYENTSTVPIAVVIDDEGAEVGDMGQINAGDMIREQLEENTQLGWTFLDSEDEAVEGVRSGRYYAAFVVPSDFTASLGDIVDGDVSPAHISYYVNEKANAVAPKVTDTGSTTLDNEITDQFLEVAGKTVTEKLQDAMGGAATKADEARDTVVTDLRDVSGTLAGPGPTASTAPRAPSPTPAPPWPRPAPPCRTSPQRHARLRQPDGRTRHSLRHPGQGHEPGRPALRRPRQRSRLPLRHLRRRQPRHRPGHRQHRLGPGQARRRHLPGGLRLRRHPGEPRHLPRPRLQQGGRPSRRHRGQGRRPCRPGRRRRPGQAAQADLAGRWTP